MSFGSAFLFLIINILRKGDLKLQLADFSVSHPWPISGGAILASGGQGLILRSIDSGLTWRKPSSLTSGSGTDLQQPITSILFNSTQTGLAAGQGLWSTRESLCSSIPMSPLLVATFDHAWTVGIRQPRSRFLSHKSRFLESESWYQPRSRFLVSDSPGADS
jgi:hypothetical protein